MKKKLVFKVVTGILILAIFGLYGFSRVVLNKGETTFDDPPAGSSSVATTTISKADTTIRQLIVEGAGYFLDSYSDVLRMLNKVELAELTVTDYSEIQKIADSAIANLEKARESYASLNRRADATPQNGDMIEKLLLFDYEGFLRGKGLNTIIFQDLHTLLAQGDVRAVFTRMQSNTESLLGRLYQIKAMLDTAEFPPISRFWQLNNEFAGTLLFGQYAAQVFYEISGSAY